MHTLVLKLLLNLTSSFCVEQAVHGAATSQGPISDAPHLANLPNKQTTAVTNTIEPGHERKGDNEK